MDIFDRVGDLMQSHRERSKIKYDLHDRVEEVFFRYLKAKEWIKPYTLKRDWIELEEWNFFDPYGIEVIIPDAEGVTTRYTFSLWFLHDDESLGWFEEEQKWMSENMNSLEYTKPVRFSSTGNYGCVPSNEDDVYTISEFRKIVENGGFVDSDGSGSPVKDGKACHSWPIRPSKLNEIPPDATHIVWYNK